MLICLIMFIQPSGIRSKETANSVMTGIQRHMLNQHHPKDELHADIMPLNRGDCNFKLEMRRSEKIAAVYNPSSSAKDLAAGDNCLLPGLSMQPTLASSTKDVSPAGLPGTCQR